MQRFLKEASPPLVVPLPPHQYVRKVGSLSRFRQRGCLLAEPLSLMDLDAPTSDCLVDSVIVFVRLGSSVFLPDPDAEHVGVVGVAGVAITGPNHELVFATAIDSTRALELGIGPTLGDDQPIIRRRLEIQITGLKPKLGIARLQLEQWKEMQKRGIVVRKTDVNESNEITQRQTYSGSIVVFCKKAKVCLGGQGRVGNVST